MATSEQLLDLARTIARSEIGAISRLAHEAIELGFVSAIGLDNIAARLEERIVDALRRIDTGLPLSD
jgi:hypothetical protein